MPGRMMRMACARSHPFMFGLMRISVKSRWMENGYRSFRYKASSPLHPSMISYPSRASMHFTSSTISSLSSTIRIVFLPFMYLPLIDPGAEARLFPQRGPDGLADPPAGERGETSMGGIEVLG